MSYVGIKPPLDIPSGVEQPDYFTLNHTYNYNYTNITSDATTTVPAGRNGFLTGPITVDSGVTWTISGTLFIF